MYQHYDRYGFTIDDVGERNWEEDTAFSLKSVYGTDGADLACDAGRHYT